MSTTQNLTASRSLGGTLCGFCFLVLFSVTFFHQPLIAGKAFHVWDHSIIYVPMHVYNARLRAEGEIPLWNRHAVLGYPTQAETELSGVYIPSLVFNIISDSSTAYKAYVFGHVLLALASMMFLAKVAGATPLGQTAAGLVFVFGGSYVGHNYTLTLLTTMSWAPLILALQLLALESTRLRYAVLAGVALAVQTSGAHPQGSFYTLLMMGAASLSGGVGLSRLRLAGKVMAVSLLVGFGLAAPQLLYLMESMSASSGRWAGMGYEWQVVGSPPPLHLLQLIVPDFLGHGYDPDLNFLFGDQRFYSGLLAIALFMIGWRARVRPVWLFRAIVVASTLLALGRYGGLYQILYRLPGFRSIHIPGRFFLVASLGASVLIGLGLDRLVFGNVNLQLISRRLRWGFGVLAALLAAMSVGAWLSLESQGLAEVYDGAVKLGLDPVKKLQLPSMEANQRLDSFAGAALKASLLAASCCVFGFLATRFRRTWMVGAMGIVLLAVDLFVSNAVVCLYGSQDFYRVVPDTVAELRQKPGLWRMVALDARGGYIHPELRELPQNVPALFAVDAVQCNLGAPRDDVVEFFGDVFTPEASTKEFGVFNVRYFLIQSDGNATQPPGPPHHSEWRIVENPQWQPRAALRSNVTLVRSVSEARSEIRSARFDPNQCVTLMEPPVYVDGEPVDPPPPGSTLAVRSYEAQRVVIDAVVSEDSVLVLADLHHPGWLATSNGRPVRTLTANGLTRGVALGPGRHHVVFAYRPRSFYAGLVVSAMTLVVLAVCGGITGIRRSENRRRVKRQDNGEGYRSMGAVDPEEERSPGHRPRSTSA